MFALDIVKKYYKGTNVESELTTGIISNNTCLDCNCIDCGEDADCSTPW